MVRRLTSESAFLNVRATVVIRDESVTERVLSVPFCRVVTKRSRPTAEDDTFGAIARDVNPWKTAAYRRAPRTYPWPFVFEL